MSSIAFDTFKFSRRLKEMGVPEAHAEAQGDSGNYRRKHCDTGAAEALCLAMKAVCSIGRPLI